MISRRSLLLVAPLLGLPRPMLAGRRGVGGTVPGIQEINTRDSLGGTLVNAYGTWGFGRGIVRATGAGPPGPFGAFHYVTLNGKVIKQISTGTAGDPGNGAQQIVLDSGQIFTLTAQNDRWWQEYTGYFDQFVDSPNYTPILPAPALPTPITYPYTPVSSDGLSLTSSPGTLTTVDGVWSNGAGGATFQPTLNGITYTLAQPTTNRLQIASNGQMFSRDNPDGQWYLLGSYGRYSVGFSIPTGPIPIIVNQTPNPAVMTPGDVLVTLSPSTPINTVISTMSAVMSDGSTYGGPYSSSFGQPWAAMSGANLVTTGAPVSGFYVSHVAAQVGGVFAGLPGAQSVYVLVP